MKMIEYMGVHYLELPNSYIGMYVAVFSFAQSLNSFCIYIMSYNEVVENGVYEKKNYINKNHS